eukprot:3625628-Rhodomonas_salina.1
MLLPGGPGCTGAMDVDGYDLMLSPYESPAKILGAVALSTISCLRAAVAIRAMLYHHQVSAYASAKTKRFQYAVYQTGFPFDLSAVFQGEHSGTTGIHPSIALRARYAMSGTDIVDSDIVLCDV